MVFFLLLSRCCFKALYRKLWLGNVPFLPPRQTSRQMFLATKRTQLQIVSQRKRRYKYSYLCLSPNCKMSQILGWKNTEILSWNQKKNPNFLNAPNLFRINAKYIPLTFQLNPASPSPLQRQLAERPRKAQVPDAFSCPPFVAQRNQQHFYLPPVQYKQENGSVDWNAILAPGRKQPDISHQELY